VGLIAQEGLEAEALLCAGDICNRADPAALKHAWAELNRVAAALGADLVATVGNHDLDHTGAGLEVDPKAALVDLQPPFPFDDDDQKHRYWSQDFAIYRRGGLRIVTLNSCALHGHVFGRKPEEWAAREAEFEHGRISPATARRLADALAADPDEYAVNILLTHHHVVQLPGVDLKDHSVMLQAQELLEALMPTGPWMVVHGHKHRARVFYAPGPSDAPVIMAAGSFSAYPYGQVQSTQQVYLVEFASREEQAHEALTISGEIRAWNWSSSTWRWNDATSNSDGVLPARAGFGWRINSRQLAQKIASLASVAPSARLSGEALETALPLLRFLVPADLQRALTRLEAAVPACRGHLSSSGRLDSVEVVQAAVAPAAAGGKKAAKTRSAAKTARKRGAGAERGKKAVAKKVAATAPAVATPSSHLPEKKVAPAPAKRAAGAGSRSTRPQSSGKAPAAASDS
jgi:predicted phosphodiesterase